MKRIKKSALCALLLVAQFQNCIADAQGDGQKSQDIIEQVESADTDATVQAEPYISKSAMLKIAAGMFVIAVGWRYLADYYGIFPYDHVAEGEEEQSSTEPTTRQSQENVASHDGAVSDEQDARSWDQAIKKALYDFFRSGAPEVEGEQEEDWGAKHEREAKVDAAYRAAYQEAKAKIKAAEQQKLPDAEKVQELKNEGAARKIYSEVIAELKSKVIDKEQDGNENSEYLDEVSLTSSNSKPNVQSLAEYMEAKNFAETQNKPEHENPTLPQVQEVELQHGDIYPDAAQNLFNLLHEQDVVATDSVSTAPAHDDQNERAMVALAQAAQARNESDNLLDRAAAIREQVEQNQQKAEVREQALHKSFEEMLKRKSK